MLVPYMHSAKEDQRIAEAHCAVLVDNQRTRGDRKSTIGHGSAFVYKDNDLNA